MQVCYIPATGFDLKGTAVARGYIQNAIEGALSNVIVKPFKHWCYGVWCGIVDISLPACTMTSLVSLMLYMIGVKKARQWIIIPIIVYLFLQMADHMISGGAN